MQKISTGKIRLPGFNGEWKKVKLKNTGVIVTGTTPSTKIKEYYENGVYPWVTPTDITEKKYISKTERYLTYKGLKVGRFLPAGSLLVTCIASIGKNAILTTDGSCNQQINAILPSKNHSNEFLYYLISYRVDYIKSYAGTSATQIINKSTFENLKFFIPSLPEQKAIAKVLSTADREIDLLTQELEQLKLQKKGLMQLLLTGIVRV
jgi:type I restriction enzyme S subunit